MIGRYDARAPRYTSLPTAAQFTPAVGPATGPRPDWSGDVALRAVNRTNVISSHVDRLLREADLVLPQAGR
ncbi:MAG: hypothetical protein ACK4MY_04025 [Brevundimonas sp.]